ncbi:MAG: ATP-dependent DNA helicase RecG [Mariprofundaceae bacterium]
MECDGKAAVRAASIYDTLLLPVSELHGVGKALAGRLAARGVRTLGDLLLHRPKDWLDDRRITPIAALRPGEEARIRGRILERRASGHGRRRMVSIRLADDSGGITLHFFHSVYMLRDARLQEGREISARGKPEIWRGEWRMTHPSWCVAEAHVPSIVPIYPMLAGMRPGRVAGLIEQALSRLPKDAAGPADAFAGTSLAVAFHALHAEPDPGGNAQALARLKAEELIVYLALMRERKRRAACPGPAMRDDALDTRLLAALPYPLTPAQRQAWSEIAGDLASGRRMHRLLQGDVGAGKTWVAALASARACSNGYQAALMAPTEVLARQHHDTLRALLAPLGLKVGLLTGGMGAKARREALAAMAGGTWDVTVGTHALLGEDVRFARLGLAMVDEQHRFGVRQRWALTEKGTNGEAVHMLGMTATPIPRSLALALYGDMELSVMRGMPPGRKPVETRVLAASGMAALRAGMRRILDAGGRIYWIAPRIDEEEDGASVRQRAEALARHFPDADVRALHGRMKAVEKQAALAAFASGECRILVSTTVVEVGVNVPEARLIVIEQAEGYGLAQLHQLRGRVGRSSEQGYCILIAGEGATPQAVDRLAQMVRCHDGLELAEADLRLRGAGDALGVRQSGEIGFRLVDPVMDADLIRSWHERLAGMADEWLPDAAMQAFWRPEAAPVD